MSTAKVTTRDTMTMSVELVCELDAKRVKANALACSECAVKDAGGFYAVKRSRQGKPAMTYSTHALCAECGNALRAFWHAYNVRNGNASPRT